MYESCFCRQGPVSSLTRESRFRWLPETREERLAALCYGRAHRKGFILLTGGIGAGKTTLLRAAAPPKAEGEEG
jgi:general secretion pathway protein A